MNELKLFQLLKSRILESYQKSYPYFQGSWKSFSSKDISQLIDLIEVQLKEKVSEKWIYTHLKPETNEKLPRKDMLDIFSRFVGFESWDEFVFKNSIENSEISGNTPKSKKKNTLWLLVFIPIIVLLVSIFAFKNQKKVITLKNEITKQPIKEGEIEVYQISENEKKPLEIVNSTIEVENKEADIVLKSPYFETKEIKPSQISDEILMKPEDYAVVLKTFIESEIKDWDLRKEKLDKILSDDLEVILFQKENLGAEHLNKKEFSEKLILPTSETKNFKIIDLETDSSKKITFIRIQKT
jgi:predicted DNA-binding transcriptional regulator AlpA/competence protein ComGC